MGCGSSKPRRKHYYHEEIIPARHHHHHHHEHHRDGRHTSRSSYQHTTYAHSPRASVHSYHSSGPVVCERTSTSRTRYV